MTATRYQYEWTVTLPNGTTATLLMGRGTNYIVESVAGLQGLPAISSSQLSRPTEHGALLSPQVISKRVIDMEIRTIATPGSAEEDAIQTLQKMFPTPYKRLYVAGAPVLLGTLKFARPFPNVGFPTSDRELTVKAKVAKREIVSDYTLGRGLIKCPVQLVAPDPILYNTVVTTATVSIASGSASGGLNSSAWQMLGNAPDGVLPTSIVVTGPARNPRFGVQNPNPPYNVGAAQTLKFDFDLAAGQELRIDPVRRSASIYTTAGGAFVADAFQYIRTDSIWFRMLPTFGVNGYTLSYTRDPAALTTGIATFTLTWQDGYMY